MNNSEAGSIDNEQQAVSPKERMLRELARRREAKEISPHNFDLNFLFQLNELAELEGTPVPLKRSDLDHQAGVQAVVLTSEELRILGFFDYIDSSGKVQLVVPEKFPNGVVLFPEDLGDEEIPA